MQVRVLLLLRMPFESARLLRLGKLYDGSTPSDYKKTVIIGKNKHDGVERHTLGIRIGERLTLESVHIKSTVLTLCTSR